MRALPLPALSHCRTAPPRSGARFSRPAPPCGPGGLPRRRRRARRRRSPVAGRPPRVLTVWRHLPRLRDRSRFDAWLIQIVRNRCRDILHPRSPILNRPSTTQTVHWYELVRGTTRSGDSHSPPRGLRIFQNASLGPAARDPGAVVQATRELCRQALDPSAATRAPVSACAPHPPAFDRTVPSVPEDEQFSRRPEGIPCRHVGFASAQPRSQPPRVTLVTLRRCRAGTPSAPDRPGRRMRCRLTYLEPERPPLP
jgi:hypothetical protein